MSRRVRDRVLEAAAGYAERQRAREAARAERGRRADAEALPLAVVARRRRDAELARRRIDYLERTYHVHTELRRVW
jgi:hypothetical protein